MCHVTSMEKWVLKNKPKLPKTKDERRGLRCVHRYARWVKYNKRGDLKTSKDYYEDGEIAKEFSKRSQFLWNRIAQLFPKHILRRVYRDLTQYELEEEQQRLCRP
jgi:hypothetical protein